MKRVMGLILVWALAVPAFCQNIFTNQRGVEPIVVTDTVQVTDLYESISGDKNYLIGVLQRNISNPIYGTDSINLVVNTEMGGLVNLYLTNKASLTTTQVGFMNTLISGDIPVKNILVSKLVTELAIDSAQYDIELWVSEQSTKEGYDVIRKEWYTGELISSVVIDNYKYVVIKSGTRLHLCDYYLIR